MILVELPPEIALAEAKAAGLVDPFAFLESDVPQRPISYPITDCFTMFPPQPLSIRRQPPLHLDPDNRDWCRRCGGYVEGRGFRNTSFGAVICHGCHDNLCR